MTLKIICSHNIAKNPFQFTNFPANMFLFGVGKNIFRNGAVPFLDTQQLYSWSTLKANACVFLYISVRKFLFDRAVKFYTVVGGGWLWLNDFLKADRCLDHLKYYTIFHFNWNIWKFNCFSHFVNFNLSLPLCYSLNFTKKL